MLMSKVCFYLFCFYFFYFFIFLCSSAQIVLDFKSFFFPFYSFYLKNDLFSLFYSGPFVYVKFDVVVELKESVLGEYYRENVKN